MFIDYTPEQHALQARLREVMAALVTPELEHELLHQEGGGPLYMAALGQLGADGWLGLSWPEAYGGQGRPLIESFIFFDECHRAGFPVPLLTLNTVGPTLMAVGTEAQRQRFLPDILAGKTHFSVAYTEPSAGTDLGSLTTKATRDGDDYIVDGQKVFCSLADHADYFWTAVRTDPDCDPHGPTKHKGISLIIVPADAEGVSTTPIKNVGDNNLHALYLDKVRVPATNLVGAENKGWRTLTTQLNHERIALMMVGPLARFTEEVRDWAATTPSGADGQVLDLPWVQMNLARLDAHVEVLRLMNWKQVWCIENDTMVMQDASALKVFGSELNTHAFRWLMEILGAAATIKTGSPGAVLKGELERYYRGTLVLTFGGGVNEVQRDIVAMAGLGLPRGRR
jgi:alkylation response protein AidB-like acyl-CoA dehydrogenase